MRLSWASGLVRERACVEIARLLQDVHYGSRVEERLLAWITAQQFENLAAIGLLAFCHARDLGAHAPLADLVSQAVKRPSILSWILQRDLNPSIAEPDLFVMHSGTADSRFSPDPFFMKHIKAAVPPIYEIMANRLSDRYGISLSNQWAYEWSCLHKELARAPRVPDVYFWVHHGSKRLVALDVVESEFYLSAFLRALAWATSRGRISTSVACYYACQLCPINLDLWLVKPGSQPDWWPKGNEPSSIVDTTPGDVLATLTKLWSAQSSIEWCIAEASGVVREGEVTYDIEITGVIQTCAGPVQPDMEVFYRRCRRSAVMTSSKMLRLEGEVPYESEADCKIPDADWSAWPLSASLDTVSMLRWQWWRGQRDIWAPAPWLIESGYTVNLSEQEIEYRTSGVTFARWTDWMHRFTELAAPNMPSSTGQVLLIRRDLIEQAADLRQGNFAWLCKWRAYRRKTTYSEDVEESSGLLTFGVTQIVR